MDGYFLIVLVYFKNPPVRFYNHTSSGELIRNGIKAVVKGDVPVSVDLSFFD